MAPQARRILDVGTGSGAIALALARERPDARVVASDRVATALAVARTNVVRTAPTVALVQGDLVAPYRAGAFDLVVANPPYCAVGTVVQAEVARWEPAAALYAGADGLAVLEALVRDVPRVLASGGWLAVEMGVGQAAVVARRADEMGCWERVDVVRDGAGIERVLVARRRPG
jgi:release factor glutamine methyltransferase